jgi:hypothetical protein
MISEGRSLPDCQTHWFMSSVLFLLPLITWWSRSGFILLFTTEIPACLIMRRSFIYQKFRLVFWRWSVGISVGLLANLSSCVVFLNVGIKLKGQKIELLISWGCAIAQAVSRRLPTAAAWVRSQPGPCRTCDRQSATGAGFLRVVRFPLPILILLTAPHSSSPTIRGWYNRPISGRRTKWIVSTIPKKLKKNRQRRHENRRTRFRTIRRTFWLKLRKYINVYVCVYIYAGKIKNNLQLQFLDYCTSVIMCLSRVRSPVHMLR